MKAPSFADSYEVICLQAGDAGRKDVLFGSSFERARKIVRPFMVGKEFPDAYLEFPLIGEPFLDVTILLKELEPNTRIDSEAADGTGPMLDWYAETREQYSNIACGFELDTANPDVPTAAIHFQPRTHTELVAPFCETIGEPQRASLYLDQAARMPESWQLSFFGMFRGRPGSPLRVCGYHDEHERDECANNPEHLAKIFDEIGFTAYDEQLLEQTSELFATAPGSTDFQFDINPDGSLGSTFAIDAKFQVKQPKDILEGFTNGEEARFMSLLESWGIADARWKMGIEAAFARSIPVQLDDGTLGKYAFTLMPQWLKVRWRNGVLQPSKLYSLGSANLL